MTELVVAFTTVRARIAHFQIGNLQPGALLSQLYFSDVKVRVTASERSQQRFR